MKPTETFICALLCLCFLLSSPLVFAADKKKVWNKKDLQDAYMAYLKKEGYTPKLDGDGDVIFKSEGNTFFIAMSEEDPTFFRLILPNIWNVEGQTERAYVLAAADQSNAMCKVSKVFLVEDRVWVSIELFLASPEDFKSIFKRAIGALDAGASVFVLKMAEQVASHTQGSRKGVGERPPGSKSNPGQEL